MTCLKVEVSIWLFYSFRCIEIFRSSKAEIEDVSKAKRKPLMSTRPGPDDRPPGGFGGGQGQFGGVEAEGGRRCLLLI